MCYNKEMRRILRYFVVLLFILTFSSVGLKLFAPEVFDTLVEKIRPTPTHSRDEELIIAFPNFLTSFEPTTYTAANRSRLVNIYEALVRMDENLRVEPALAKSWGFIDDFTYEFRLRDAVKFHNGKILTSQDVKASFDRAKEYVHSEVSSFVQNIKEFQIIDSSTFRIITENPDPLFLQKLTALFIFPENALDDIEARPVGSGAYSFFRYDDTTGVLELKRFDDYWGGKPEYFYTRIFSIPDKNDRIRAVQNASVDILAPVPASLAADLKLYDVDLKLKTSLEVNFLMFSFRDGSPFLDRRVREAVSLAIHKDDLIRFTNTYTDPQDQFVSRGVFGYNPSLQPRAYDFEKAKSLMKEVERFVRIPVTVDLPEGFENFGKYLETQLYEIGFSVTLNYLAPLELQKKILDGNSQFFLFGWRSELGDSADFFTAVAQSDGQFNAISYKNKRVDALIEESSRNMDTLSRLTQLQEVMEILVEDDLVGVPLFESQVIYAVNPQIRFEPRIDGYILAKDVRLKFL